jgi:hypothetical protein
MFDKFDENKDEKLSREEFQKLTDHMRELRREMGPPRGFGRGPWGGGPPGRGGRGGPGFPPGPPPQGEPGGNGAPPAEPSAGDAAT